ncbi:hypothetical protein K491DRAFT_611786 [Lophiostoma macrostomum CBS 122681]|uniref:Peptidase A1 domain-containing protein n=1 Tax=Lophiostoma macrostomum CBS 122681 TaxID=1314788 RepID=A0A6A6SMH1_9PLEO|nr:hypothetical protein K491DRAFT_611786 [Lophiostoma macrostomum CBS 122681]
MFELIAILLLLASNSITSSEASNCQPKPIAIPIKNVPLSNNAQVHGISLSVGSPPQNISFLANAQVSVTTYIYGLNGHCSGTTPPGKCVSERGGQYDQSKSSTTSFGNDESSSDATVAPMEWVKDTLQAQDSFTLPEFNFGTPSVALNISAYQSQSQLGLGRNSTILTMLKQAGTIASRAYSFYWGLVGGQPGRQTSGSLILGGFDESIVADASNNYTASLNYRSGNCSSGLFVSISDMKLAWPNGTTNSLFRGSQSSSLSACIDIAYVGLLNLPVDYYDTFLDFAGGQQANPSRSFGLNFFTMLFEPAGVRRYYGDFMITLDNRIDIRIPNDQLVVDEPTLDDSGHLVTNSSVKNIVLDSLQANNIYDLAILGRLFFSSAYLMVNHESSTFTIWEANAKPPLPQPKAIAADNTITGDFCDNAAEPSMTPSDLDSVNSEKKHLSGGAIAGIVIGGLAGGVLVLSAVLLLVKRRFRYGSSPGHGFDSQPEYKPPAELDKPNEVMNSPPVEMPHTDSMYGLSHQSPPQELYGQPIPRHLVHND